MALQRPALFLALLALVASAGAIRLPFRWPWAHSSPCNLASRRVLRTPSGGFRFDEGEHSVDGTVVAWGSFVDGSTTASNFGQLRITTSGDFSDADQLFAAGFLEGWLTAPRIYDNWLNMDVYFRKAMNASMEGPMKWVQEQHAWVLSQCGELAAGRAPAGAEGASGRRHRRFWQAVCLVVRQYEGIVEGYRAAAAAGSDANAIGPLRDDDFLFVQYNADLYDIIDWQQPDQRPSWVQSSGTPSSRPGAAGWARLDAAAAADARGTAARLFSRVALAGKCTALVKVAADLSDIWMGHSTWDSYTAMLRIFKHYRFNLTQLQPAAHALSFSSYPSEVFSDDDFFIMDSKLVVLQTTNKIFNDALFDRLSPRTVPSWLRVRAANFLAGSGEEWAKTVETLNSGTYNNQYLVVDLGRFVPGQDLAPGLLTVVEQIPGLVAWRDMTDRLECGYFPSYNVPFFQEVYEQSGYPDFIKRIEKYGQHFSHTTHWLSYNQSPRAKQFRRDQTRVMDLESMAALMRFNDWRRDPLSEGHPIAAICGRGDLDPDHPVPRGCFDTKVTSYKLALAMEARAVNGPTRDELNSHALPAFDWRAAFPPAQYPDLQHRGQPEAFHFTFERMAPDELDGCQLDTRAAVQ